jgi:hypothetical protein
MAATQFQKPILTIVGPQFGGKTLYSRLVNNVLQELGNKVLIAVSDVPQSVETVKKEFLKSANGFLVLDSLAKYEGLQRDFIFVPSFLGRTLEQTDISVLWKYWSTINQNAFMRGNDNPVMPVIKLDGGKTVWSFEIFMQSLFKTIPNLVEANPKAKIVQYDPFSKPSDILKVVLKSILGNIPEDFDTKVAKVLKEHNVSDVVPLTDENVKLVTGPYISKSIRETPGAKTVELPVPLSLQGTPTQYPDKKYSAYGTEFTSEFIEWLITILSGHEWGKGGVLFQGAPEVLRAVCKIIEGVSGNPVHFGTVMRGADGKLIELPVLAEPVVFNMLAMLQGYIVLISQCGKYHITISHGMLLIPDEMSLEDFLKKCETSVQKMRAIQIKEQEQEQQKGALDKKTVDKEKAKKAKKEAEAKKAAKLQILEPDESTAAATSSVAFVTPTSED